MTQATIFAEHANILAHESLPARQYVLRLQAPNCAKMVKPGNFVHLSCSRHPYSLKRPFSILRASAENGWIEILYKVVGHGTAQLAESKVGEQLHCLGPIGNSFVCSSKKNNPSTIGRWCRNSAYFIFR